MNQMWHEGRPLERISYPIEIRKQGHLKKLKTMKRKYFVVWSGSHKQHARLDYFDSEKKFRANSTNPKRSIDLYTCFSINQRDDTKQKNAFIVYTVSDKLAMVADSAEDLDRWLTVLQEVHEEGFEQLGIRYPIYDYVWEATVLNECLGKSKSLTGDFRICLNSDNVCFVRVGTDSPEITFKLAGIRRCGYTNSCKFILEVGKCSKLGEGEIWMLVEDVTIAHCMHDVILGAMKSQGTKNNEKGFPRPVPHLETSRSRTGSFGQTPRRGQEKARPQSMFTSTPEKIIYSASSNKESLSALPSIPADVNSVIQSSQPISPDTIPIKVENEEKTEDSDYFNMLPQSSRSSSLKSGSSMRDRLDSRGSLQKEEGYTDMAPSGSMSLSEKSPTPTTMMPDGYMVMSPSEASLTSESEKLNDSYLSMEPTKSVSSASHISSPCHPNTKDGYFTMISNPDAQTSITEQGYLSMQPKGSSFGSDTSDVRPDRVVSYLSDDFPEDTPPRTYSLGSHPSTKRKHSYTRYNSDKDNLRAESLKSISVPHLKTKIPFAINGVSPTALSAPFKSNESDSFMEMEIYRARTLSESHGQAGDSLTGRQRTSSFGRSFVPYRSSHRPRSSSHGQTSQFKRPIYHHSVRTTSTELLKQVSHESLTKTSRESLLNSHESLRKLAIEECARKSSAEHLLTKEYCDMHPVSISYKSLVTDTTRKLSSERDVNSDAYLEMYSHAINKDVTSHADERLREPSTATRNVDYVPYDPAHETSQSSIHSTNSLTPSPNHTKMDDLHLKKGQNKFRIDCTPVTCDHSKTCAPPFSPLWSYDIKSRLKTTDTMPTSSSSLCKANTKSDKLTQRNSEENAINISSSGGADLHEDKDKYEQFTSQNSLSNVKHSVISRNPANSSEVSDYVQMEAQNSSNVKLSNNDVTVESRKTKKFDENFLNYSEMTTSDCFDLKKENLIHVSEKSHDDYCLFNFDSSSVKAPFSPNITQVQHVSHREGSLGMMKCPLRKISEAVEPNETISTKTVQLSTDNLNLLSNPSSEIKICDHDVQFLPHSVTESLPESQDEYSDNLQHSSDTSLIDPVLSEGVINLPSKSSNGDWNKVMTDSKESFSTSQAIHRTSPVVRCAFKLSPVINDKKCEPEEDDYVSLSFQKRADTNAMVHSLHNPTSQSTSVAHAVIGETSLAYSPCQLPDSCSNIKDILGASTCITSRLHDQSGKTLTNTTPQSCDRLHLDNVSLSHGLSYNISEDEFSEKLICDKVSALIVTDSNCISETNDTATKLPHSTIPRFSQTASQQMYSSQYQEPKTDERDAATTCSGAPSHNVKPVELTTNSISQGDDIVLNYLTLDISSSESVNQQFSSKRHKPDERLDPIQYAVIDFVKSEQLLRDQNINASE